MTRIAIIGAGLSGRLLAINLLQQAISTVSILMIDRNEERALGAAYSGVSDYLLLNVPAGRMGALSEDSEQFLKWVKGRGIQAQTWDFLPRRLYKEYILELENGARKERTNGPLFEYLRGEVISLEIDESGVTLHLDGGISFRVDKVVLALGNFPPRHPKIINRKTLESVRYMQIPWVSGVLDSLRRNDTLFLIGTGQTMIDLAVELFMNGHKGQIVALSRRGLLPLAHAGFEQYPSFYDEIKDSHRVIDIFRTIRKHLKLAETMGIDTRAVIDSLRPDTQALWLGLPPVEKRKFLRHLFRYWEIIRSRIPPENEERIEKMRSSGQLQILAGTIHDMVETEAAIEVHCLLRGSKGTEIVRAALVVNCIGPESDFGRIDHPLVKSLIRNGLIRPGPAQLGIDALPNGAIVGRNGKASEVLYTLGSTMRGVLWEVLAVPEIRVQARQLAFLLLRDELRQPARSWTTEP
jgi:uncharacterized NAD(P)/FAD-binding protein YdhS